MVIIGEWNKEKPFREFKVPGLLGDVCSSQFG